MADVGDIFTSTTEQDADKITEERQYGIKCIKMKLIESSNATWTKTWTLLALKLKERTMKYLHLKMHKRKIGILKGCVFLWLSYGNEMKDVKSWLNL